MNVRCAEQSMDNKIVELIPLVKEKENSELSSEIVKLKRMIKEVGIFSARITLLLEQVDSHLIIMNEIVNKYENS